MSIMELSLENILSFIKTHSIENIKDEKGLKDYNELKDFLNYMIEMTSDKMVKLLQDNMEVVKYIHNLNKQIKLVYLEFCNKYNLKPINYNICLSDDKTFILTDIGLIFIEYKTTYHYMKMEFFKHNILFSICHEIGHSFINNNIIDIVDGNKLTNNECEYIADIIAFELMSMMNVELIHIKKYFILNMEYCKCDGNNQHNKKHDSHPYCSDRIKNLEDYYNKHKK